MSRHFPKEDIWMGNESGEGAQYHWASEKLKLNLQGHATLHELE